MDCKDIQPRLSAWIDGALDHAEDTLIRAHIETCPTCGKEAEALKKLSVLLRRSQDRDLSRGFRARLMAQLLQREREEQPLWILIGMKIGWIIGTSRGIPVIDRSRAVLTYAEYRRSARHLFVPSGEDRDRIRSIEIPHSWLHQRR